MTQKQIILKLLKLNIKFEEDKGADVTFETKYSSDGYPLFLANYSNEEGVKTFMYEDNFQTEMYDYIRERLNEEDLQSKTIVVLPYDEEEFDEYIDWNDFHKQAINFLTNNNLIQ